MGTEVPDDLLQDEKVLAPELKLFYYGYLELTHDRQLGLGIEGPIPTIAILQYCGHYQMSSDLTETFLSCVRQLDIADLEHKAKKREAENKAKKKGKKHG